MIRVVGLLGLAVLTGAASPPTFLFGSGQVYREATLSANGGAVQGEVSAANRYAPAPVPDRDEAAPVLPQLGPPQPQFSPTLTRPQSTYFGEGYVAGSTVEGTEQRHYHPAPGFALTVPLE